MLIDTRVPVPRRRLAVASAVFALVAMTGCSSSDGGGGGGSSTSPAGPSASGSSSASASGTGAGTATLVIKNFTFMPASLTVAPGAVVTVRNEDQTAHTVTATGSKPFDTGVINAGGTKTFTAPGNAGSFSYICSIHTFMKGTLVVG